MLEIRGIEFSFNNRKVLQDLTFSVSPGAHFSVMGESGSGKSTLLKLIFGSLDPDRGQIVWNGKKILGPREQLIPGADGVRYMAQDFGLMPYVTVAENIGQNLSNADLVAKRRRIEDLLKLVRMESFAQMRSDVLSGGQQQRVGLAMTLASRPKMLLLDEPFSQIDTSQATQLRRSVYNHCRENGIMCIVATHDPVDVLSFSDQVLILRDGKQIGPENVRYLYDHPKDIYSARLFGEAFVLETENGNSTIVYPHQLVAVAQSDLKVTVLRSYFRGSHYLIEAQYSKGALFFENPVALPPTMELFLSRRN